MDPDQEENAQRPEFEPLGDQREHPLLRRIPCPPRGAGPVGPEAGEPETIDLITSPFSIGRLPHNHGRLQSLTIAEQHCTLTRVPGSSTWIVQVHADTVCLNERRQIGPDESARVNPGDMLQIGQCASYKYILISANHDPYTCVALLERAMQHLAQRKRELVQQVTFDYNAFSRALQRCMDLQEEAENFRASLEIKKELLEHCLAEVQDQIHSAEADLANYVPAQRIIYSRMRENYSNFTQATDSLAETLRRVYELFESYVDEATQMGIQELEGLQDRIRSMLQRWND